MQLLGCALNGRTHFGVALRQIPDDDVLGVFHWIVVPFVNNAWCVLFFCHQLKCCASELGFWEFIHPCCSPICFGAPGLLSSSGWRTSTQPVKNLFLELFWEKKEQVLFQQQLVRLLGAPPVVLPL